MLEGEHPSRTPGGPQGLRGCTGPPLSAPVLPALAGHKSTRGPWEHGALTV